MKKRTKSTIAALVFLIGLFATSSVGFTSQEAGPLKGLKSIKAVFDLRMSSAKSAALHLDLIHKTFKGKAVASVTKKPEFVVVFLGPAVKFISTSREGIAPEDHKTLDAIAGTISKMAKDGIKLEICLVAARIFKVDPATILPEIKQEENGWISLIGYQAKGYSLIPAY
jgi:intracellular sulfur oxidation DsrE/DsrF family protein